MNLFKNMLKLTRMVPQTREFDQWFDEVREMMHREVNYDIEAATTRRFAERLKDDPLYRSTIVDEFCTDQVLCMTFERGVPINSPVMLSLPQERRNQLGEASLEIAVRELSNGVKCKLIRTLVITLFV
jgi:predicted unusual protein kinase regulating ubiquinone biosynthesis (AarF/ABC1/UbiB family)